MDNLQARGETTAHSSRGFDQGANLLLAFLCDSKTGNPITPESEFASIVRWFVRSVLV